MGELASYNDVLPLEKTVVADEDQSSQPLAAAPPLLSSYNDMKHKMRPLFDAIHTLRCMNIIEEGDESLILKPTVVIGDRSSGKSSLIESLTGISLPRGNGNGICTWVPLIIRFQHRSDPVSEFHLEYKDKSVPVNGQNASAWISSLTECLADTDKEISNLPLTLVVNTNNVPDVTIVDLPGIPFDGQSEMISGILEKYIKLEDCVILHVISAANADFPTCESIKILDKFGKNYGERTLHVCTKADEASKDMVAIVSTNYMGPDYVCVRNRLGDETHEEARTKEASFFENHHLLSKIDKSLMGVQALAQKLLLVQVEGVSNRLCALFGVINKELNTCVAVHNRLQQQHNFTTVSEAMPAFVQIMKESKKSLCKIVLTKEFDEFPDETQMHCRIKLKEMANEFSKQIKNHQVKKDEESLAEEIHILERKWSTQQAFEFFLERKIADISGITNTFVSQLWDYIEFVIIKLLGLHAQNLYPQLFLSLEIAAKAVVDCQKESFKGQLLEILNINKMRCYTSDERVMSLSSGLKMIERRVSSSARDTFLTRVTGHVQNYPRTILDEAFDIKTRIVACLTMIHEELFNLMEKDLAMMVYNMVDVMMETQMVNELKSDDENRYNPMLKEWPSMATRRWKLTNRIELLKKLKKVVENVMSEIPFHNF
ncbi:dynamin-related protein 4C-like [Bidens hawaiensis]|uniref:dynamin-related protein 4C-like n=1 Tax=Bidens hawaiensis TaxID=980011 RepID=UPI00404922AA